MISKKAPAFLGTPPGEGGGGWGKGGVEKHDEDAGDGEDDFGEDAQDVRDGGQVHFWPPSGRLTG